MMLKNLEISHSPGLGAPFLLPVDGGLVSAHEKVEDTVYTTLYFYLRQRGIREEIRFAHPPTSGGILPSTIKQPVGYITINH